MNEKLSPLRSWLAARKLTAAEHMVRKLQSRQVKYLKRLDKHKKNMEHLLRQMESVILSMRKKLDIIEKKWSAIVKAAAEDLEHYEELLHHSEQVMNALQSENKIMRDIEIPQLSMKKQLELQELKTRIAQLARGQVMVMPNEERLE